MKLKLFNPFLIIKVLSTILLIECAAFLLCLPVSYIYDEPGTPFYLSAGICFMLSLVFSLISQRTGKSRFSNRDAYLVVAFAWVLFLVMATLPYIFSGIIPSFIDAFFETSSGFTTTGSTVISDLTPVPKSILFWRSLTHWIGGLGIIALVIIILPSLKVTGYQLFTLESSLREKIHPRTKAIGFRILFIYLGLTVAQVIFLSLGEMDIFESICHTFATVATGGFGLKNDSLISYSSYSQYVIMVFMFLAGISQVVYYYLFKFNFHKIRHNEELWFYIVVTVVAGTLLSSILFVNSSATPEYAIRSGFFNAVSLITTTGFVSADYLFWPAPAIMVLFLLFFAGASTGSTTGSIKMARHIIVIKSIKAALVKLIHPSAVQNVRFNDKIVSEKTCISIISFVVLYLFIFLIGTILIVITGSDVVTAASATAASLGNIGPGMGLAGPLYNYAHFPEAAKIIFSVLMILGRVEIIAILTLFTGSFWKL
ncbi:MAG TPA: TrkH family potassium uptake protein [Bacteroidales bacterium]|nr:TrkH family potassium uptake protein [Bacteroidales bacterium]